MELARPRSLTGNQLATKVLATGNMNAPDSQNNPCGKKRTCRLGYAAQQHGPTPN
jgi:hypothetical protein